MKWAASEVKLLILESACIYWAATIAGAFSGFIAYGLGKNLTVESTGRDSWRWLFIIEGCMAIFVGLVVWIVLPPFPESLKRKTWLFTPTEVELANQRSASESALNPIQGWMPANLASLQYHGISYRAQANLEDLQV